MWLVMLSCKGGYKLHSVHKDEDKARDWRDCKSFDGDDAIVVEIGKDAIEEIVRSYEEA